MGRGSAHKVAAPSTCWEVKWPGKPTSPPVDNTSTSWNNFRFKVSFTQSVCFLLWPQTGNSIFSNTTSQHLHGSLRYEIKPFGLTDEDVTMLLEIIGGVVLHAAKVRRIWDTSSRWRSFGVVVSLTHACDRYLFSGEARAADVRRKNFPYRGRWKCVSVSVPEAL